MAVSRRKLPFRYFLGAIILCIIFFGIITPYTWNPPIESDTIPLQIFEKPDIPKNAKQSLLNPSANITTRPSLITTVNPSSSPSINHIEKKDHNYQYHTKWNDSWYFNFTGIKSLIFQMQNPKLRYTHYNAQKKLFKQDISHIISWQPPSSSFVV